MMNRLLEPHKLVVRTRGQRDWGNQSEVWLEPLKEITKNWAKKLRARPAEDSRLGEQEAKEIATRIADFLFVDGSGQWASHLKLYRANWPLGSGWAKHVVINRIASELMHVSGAKEK